MQPSTIALLQSIAPQIASGEVTRDSSLTVQRAIAIYQILSDGGWHTSTAIAQELGFHKEWVRKLLRALKDPWELATHRSKGYMLVQKDSIIIV